MKYLYTPRGVCTREIAIEVDENNIIQSVQFTNGCHGNLQGIASLLKGMPAEQAIEKLKGIRCGQKTTSCPDQLALALEEMLKTQQKEQENV